MSSVTLLRPGSVIGDYPEREDIRDSWLQKFVDGTTGLLRQYLHSRGPHYSEFVKAINACSGRLNGLDEHSLKEEIASIRKRLYWEGLKEELVTESFAITREVASRKMGLRHHDVQLYGGWVMLQGMVAEMETGEGKTLTATLPACTAAMAGIPVHIVTVNDFLVSRDSSWMSPIYHALGLTVGTITESMTPQQRQEAYACDITYCSNKQLVFDYLKDRLLLEQEDRRLHLQLEDLYKARPRTSRLLLRGLCFAIVDEADSILIDEARTPLVISRSGNTLQEEMTYKQAIQLADMLHQPADFTINNRDRHIELTELGKFKLAKATKGMDSVWKGVKRRHSLVKQALAALHLYILDKHYLVKDGKIQIIDEYTGRVMADRSWERGLHQMIEAKESCNISGRQETLARISYQKFFRRYLRLAGMTGTAQEVTRELWSVYRLNVVRIPTNKPVRRQHLSNLVYVTAEQKWKKILQSIQEIHEQQRPVLVGTRSVATSEYIGNLLSQKGLRHKVLNARQDQHEAEIIAQAGQPGSISVATNMAGRGTDIRLAPGMSELGGLHVLASEIHEARRIDRQLFGRGGRQGDPGSYQTIVSLQDELISEFYGKILIRIFSGRDEPLPVWLGNLLLGLVQVRAERHHSHIRKELLKHDNTLSDMLAFSGSGE